jgi:hypothetical protein
MAIPTPYVASLRVYEPFYKFPEANRNFWEKSFNGEDSKKSEQLNSLRRMILSESPSGKVDGAHILEIEGEKFVAPWTTSSRYISALTEFRSSLPSSVVKFFLPYEVDGSINIFGDEALDRVPHILTANWMIPPRWFALFSSEDRASENNPYPTIIFRAKLESAIARGLRAHSAVVRAFGNGTIEEELSELVTWLKVFDSASILELDYGGLAMYLDASLAGSGNIEDQGDTSVEDVEKSLLGLERGDGNMAGVGYERLISRWRRVAEFERAN